MSQLTLTSFGNVDDTIRFDQHPELTVGAEDVLVAVEATPVNPVDFLLASGYYAVRPELPAGIGGEGVGRVTEVGTGADKALLGKRVLIVPTFRHGSWADSVVVPANEVVVVPDSVDTLQLAMLGINPATAYLLLNQYVDLKPGDWIGQNLGNSALGQIIIALAKRAGVRTLSVVRRTAVIEPLHALGADLVLLDGDDLADRIGQALDGQQLSLVLDGTGDATTGALVGALKFGGTAVSYASLTGSAATPTLQTLIFNDVRLRGFSLLNWLRDAPYTEIAATYALLADLIAEGVINAPVEATYPIGDYQQAFDHARKQGRSGKILFTFPSAR